ncbi:MAG: hypothetical protein WKF47_13885 [Geodermatophilaceae bacterium]
MDTTVGDERRAAEQRARTLIDRQLETAGWAVQDVANRNLYAVQGVVVREAVMAKGHGRADYLLYVDQRAVGVIEAKPVGTPLSGVEWQSAMYAAGLAPEVRLQGADRTTGGCRSSSRPPVLRPTSPTASTPHRGPDGSSRFPRPETLARTSETPKPEPDAPTWRAKVQHMPPLDRRGTAAGADRGRPRHRAQSGRAAPSTGPWCRWPPAPARPTPP